MKKHCLAFLFLLTAFSSVAAQDLVDPATIQSGYTEDGAEEVVIIATPTGVDSINHYIAWKAKHLLEEKSGGRIFANVYEAGAFGTDRETIEAVVNGTVDFFITISPIYAPFVPEAGIFDLPNAFPNVEVAREAFDSGLAELVRPAYEKAGLKFWGFSDGWFRNATSSRPLRSIDDFKGLKVRTMENPNHMAYWTAIGSNPTPMDFSELYISLQQGTIDAEENSYDLIVANKLYEPQKYIIETQHVPHNLTMPMSKMRYDSLSPEFQAIAEASVREALAYGREVADIRIETHYKKIITDYGCEISPISPELRQELITRAQSVYDTIRRNLGSDLVDKYLAVISEAEKTVAARKK